jgi:hypothetical protein
MMRKNKFYLTLIEHKKISEVTFSKKHIIATVTKEFMPDDLEALCKETGRTARATTKDDENFIIFSRK